jgi:hypothetical protein
MKIVRILLGVVSLAVTVISAAILVVDQIQFGALLGLLPPILAFQGWFWGFADVPSAIFPLLLLLAGAFGLHLATK